MLRVRLYGLPDDNADAVAQLREVFDVLEESADIEPKQNKTGKPTKLRFRYLTLGFLDIEA
jgi:hypothetical protein